MSREICDDTMNDLAYWLECRESDICAGVDDFGELRELFFEVKGRNPEPPTKEE